MKMPPRISFRKPYAWPGEWPKDASWSVLAWDEHVKSAMSVLTGLLKEQLQMKQVQQKDALVGSSDHLGVL